MNNTKIEIKALSPFLSTAFFCLGLFFFSSAEAAYVLPVGIPAPSFGLEESVESVYGNDNYYTHWIDNTAANCSDSGNGSPATPRCTIPSVSSLAAGSVVQLRGGPYIGSILTLGGYGTVLQPIFFRGPSSGNKINLQRGIRIRNASYLIVENISWTGVVSTPVDIRAGAIGESTTYISVRRNEATGTGTASAGSAFSGGGSSYDIAGHDIVYAWNSVHDFGVWQSATENDTHGFGVGSNHYNNWYLWNTAYHNSGDGIGNGHDANHKTYNLYIGGNHLYENRENAIDLKEVHNVVMSENDMHCYVPRYSSEGAAMVIHYGPTGGQGPYNTWTINNKIYDSTVGYAGSDVENGNYIIGNIFYNIDKAIALNNTGGGSYYVYHNTINNSGVGEWWGVTTDVLDVAGNIVANTTSGAHMRVDTSAERALATFAKELYYQGDNNVTIMWGTTYNSVAAWIAGSGKGAGSLQANPLFNNAATHDYSIQSGSPAINAGKDMSSVAFAFQTAFGASLLKDRAGVDRPNGIWDIGAYEYVSGVPIDTTPPSAPTGLVIN